MNPINSSEPPKVSLLLADVDGTLVTKEKILTDRARAAIHKLWDAGIRFTITNPGQYNSKSRSSSSITGLDLRRVKQAASAVLIGFCGIFAIIKCIGFAAVVGRICRKEKREKVCTKHHF